MADLKISAMTAASALDGTELYAGVQSGANVKITGAQIKTLVSSSPTLVTPSLGVATGTSLALGGATIGSNALAVTGTSQLNNDTSIASTATNGLQIFNTSDQVTNFEKLRLYYSGNVANIRSEAGGSGTIRSIQIGTQNAGFTIANGSNGTSGTYQYTFGASGGGNDQTVYSGTWTAASGVNNIVKIAPTINQSSTAGYTALLINPTETSTGSGSKLLIEAKIGAGSDVFSVDNTGTITSSGVFLFSSASTCGLNGSLFVGGGTSATSAVVLYRGTDNANVEVFNNGSIGFSPSSNPGTTADTVISRHGAASLQLGYTDAASPVAQTMRVQSVVGGTSATNGTNWTLIGSLSTGTGTSGDIILQTGVNPGSGTTQATATTALTLKGESQSVLVGNAALNTNATGGFLYIPTCAGTPTGTPTSFTGRVPMVFDTTNSQFWFYTGGAWKQPKTPAGAALVTWQ